jgi:segregation and condensation protein A
MKEVSQSMSPSIVLDQFEGPLGVLLDLVERHQLPVSEIAVSMITTQYLAYIATLDGLTPELLGDFLVLGSRLVYMKSLALLPTPEHDEQADEFRHLKTELEEYKRYQVVARQLSVYAQSPSWRRPGAIKSPPEELPLPEINLVDLAAAFQTALKRVVPPVPSQIIRARLSQTEILKRLETRLNRGSFSLHEMLSCMHDRLEVVLTFSALLELIRSGRSRVTQDGQFNPIMIEAVHV